MTISIKNLNVVRKVTFIITRVFLIISLGLTTCICNGQKSTWVLPTTGNRISYFSTSGKHVKLIADVMGCAILKTDDLGFRSWLQQSSLTPPQCRQIQDLGSYQKLGLMPRRCLRIKSYPYLLTIRFSSSRSKMVWIVLKQSSPTGYQLLN